MTQNKQSNSNLLVNPMPLPKLTSLLNDFIVKTTNHLNKLSVHAETKLANFDKKIKEIEVMVTLLEAKLYSLPPEITSKYPPLTYQSLNDINPQIFSTNVYEIKHNEVKEEVSQQQVEHKREELVNSEEKIEEEVVVVEETAEQKLNRLLEENNSEGIQSIYKMMKFGIPEQAVLQKARIVGIDMSLVNNLIELFRSANPHSSY